MASDAEQVAQEPNMIAVGLCYVNDRIYQGGDKFFYAGPQGRAFHLIGGNPVAKINVDALMNKAVAGAQVSPELDLVKRLLGEQGAHNVELQKNLTQLRQDNAKLADEIVLRDRALERAAAQMEQQNAALRSGKK